MPGPSSHTSSTASRRVGADPHGHARRSRECAAARWRPGCSAPAAAAPRRRAPRARPARRRPPSGSCAAARSTARRARRRWPAPAGPPRRRSSGRWASRRANNSRSSTSRPIRRDSLSMRPISISTSRAAPCRYSSANPRIVVSGVRSSWLASVMKRRIRSSDVRAWSADCSEEANARWICASIPLSASDSRPTSVRGSRSGTRRSNWPAGDRRGRLLDLVQRSQAAVHHRVAGDAEHQEDGRPDAHLCVHQGPHRGLHVGQVDGDGGQLTAEAADRHRAPLHVGMVDGAHGHRHRTDIVVCGQRRLGLAVIDRHPDVAVRVDAAHVEVRRWSSGVGSRRVWSAAAGVPVPSLARRRAGSRRRGSSGCAAGSW